MPSTPERGRDSLRTIGGAIYNRVVTTPNAIVVGSDEVMMTRDIKLAVGTEIRILAGGEVFVR